MSDKPISKGDLVYVAKAPHSCFAETLGMIGVIDELMGPGDGLCSECGQRALPAGTLGYSVDDKYVLPAAWLRRIDPPAIGEYDRVPVREKVPA